VLRLSGGSGGLDWRSGDRVQERPLDSGRANLQVSDLSALHEFFELAVGDVLSGSGEEKNLQEDHNAEKGSKE
jgi:hypothetical protein